MMFHRGASVLLTLFGLVLLAGGATGLAGTPSADPVYQPKMVVALAAALSGLCLAVAGLGYVAVTLRCEAGSDLVEVAGRQQQTVGAVLGVWDEFVARMGWAFQGGVNEPVYRKLAGSIEELRAWRPAGEDADAGD